MANCPQGMETCPLQAQIEQLQKDIARLTEQTRTDPLTGLFNRRHLLTCLTQELERTKRTDQPTSLVLLDVDHFKRVNDTYGHAVGDLALQHIAHLLKSSVRMLDIPCRQGGEEFAVVLPSTPLLVAKQVAERIRAAVEQAPLVGEFGQLALTLSLGVDSYLAPQAEGPEAFIARTDVALYAAKHAGRNCVKLAQRPATAAVSADEKAALWQTSSTTSDGKADGSKG
jgi:two-component system, cell cycle response regulator